MATAEGYLDQRTKLKTLTNRKMTKATAPASVANKVVIPSLESEARNHACANPHHPMTGTNQTGRGVLRRSRLVKMLAFTECSGGLLGLIIANMLPLRPAQKSIVLCADDYALNDSVSQGIVALAQQARLSATSVMALSPLWQRRAPALRELQGTIDVGLHLDWTSEFAQQAGWGQGLAAVMWRSLSGGLDATRVREAIERQFDAFETVWQAPPDHVDGHQHIQQFDGLREVLCEVLLRRYGQSKQKPWLRISQTHKAGFKGALISWMGAKLLERLG
jgi:hypothetical protein